MAAAPRGSFLSRRHRAATSASGMSDAAQCQWRGCCRGAGEEFVDAGCASICARAGREERCWYVAGSTASNASDVDTFAACARPASAAAAKSEDLVVGVVHARVAAATSGLAAVRHTARVAGTPVRAQPIDRSCHRHPRSRERQGENTRAEHGAKERAPRHEGAASPHPQNVPGSGATPPVTSHRSSSPATTSAQLVTDNRDLRSNIGPARDGFPRP